MSINNFAGSVVHSLLAAAAVTGTANGTGVDVSALENVAAVVLNASAASAGDTLDIHLEHSAADDTYEDITGASFTQITASAAVCEAIYLDMARVKKYIRAVVTVAGNGGESIPASVTLIGQPSTRA